MSSNEPKKDRYRSPSYLFITVVLAVFYLLSVLHYYPGQPTATLLATLDHLLKSLPLNFALLIAISLFYRKQTGIALGRARLVRYFLVIGLVFEFLYALGRHQGVGS